MLASTKVLRNWLEQRSSNQNDLLSVTGEVSRVLDGVEAFLFQFFRVKVIAFHNIYHLQIYGTIP
jgi:hypothetical protein